MERVHRLEILDGPVQDIAEFERCLAMVADTNRFLGGVRALRMSLAPLLRLSDPVRVLDVGAGNGAVARGLARWSAAQWRSWSVTALGVSRSKMDLKLFSKLAPIRSSLLRNTIRGTL